MLSNHDSNLQGCSPSLVSRKLIVGVFFLGTVFGTGIGYGYQETVKVNQSSSVVTTSRYDRIYPGMSLTDVRSILGPGTEIRRSESKMIIEWYAPEGPTITVTFQDEKLVEKEQSGLR